MRRRQFLEDSFKTAGIIAIAGMPPSLLSWSVPKKNMTVQEIIDLILKEGGLEKQENTVDTLKSGRADMIVTGIITTMFPTITVIKEAIKRKANFIIAHEPSFYNHQDSTDWLKDDKVFKEKMDLLDKNMITIWRFHDYCHSLVPDPMSYGVADKMGWLPYFDAKEEVMKIPAISLKQLATNLKLKLGATKLRIIGNLEQSCNKVALLPGAWGRERQISITNKDQPDVLIVGEISEWETGEYIRDGKLEGRNTALIILGHSISEEPGMQYVTTWLKPKLPGIPIMHIASGDPFVWI